MKRQTSVLDGTHKSRSVNNSLPREETNICAGWHAQITKCKQFLMCEETYVLHDTHKSRSVYNLFDYDRYRKQGKTHKSRSANNLCRPMAGARLKRTNREVQTIFADRRTEFYDRQTDRWPVRPTDRPSSPDRRTNRPHVRPPDRTPRPRAQPTDRRDRSAALPSGCPARPHLSFLYLLDVDVLTIFLMF